MATCIYTHTIEHGWKTIYIVSVKRYHNFSSGIICLGFWWWWSFYYILFSLNHMLCELGLHFNFDRTVDAVLGPQTSNHEMVATQAPTAPAPTEASSSINDDFFGNHFQAFLKVRTFPLKCLLVVTCSYSWCI